MNRIREVLLLLCIRGLTSEYINNNYSRRDTDIQYPINNDSEIPIDIENEITELKGIMIKYCGIIRNEFCLNLAVNYINKLMDRLNDVSVNKLESMELYNMAIIAQHIAIAALNRKDSIGAHYREEKEIC